MRWGYVTGSTEQDRIRDFLEGNMLEDEEYQSRLCPDLSG
jgi:hypothetical protein